MTTKALLERIAVALESAKPARMVMDTQAASEYLGVHTNTIHKLVESYGLPCYPLTNGGCYRFHRNDLDAWIRRRRVQDMESHKKVLSLKED